MKRKSLIFTALLGLVMLFASCEKEITTSALVVDETKTATVKIFVKADLSALTAGNENAPDDTKVLLSIKNTNLNGAFTGNDRWTTTASVSGGVVNVTVPTTADGTTLIVDVVTFEHKYTIDATTTEDYVFTLMNEELAIGTVGTHNVHTINLAGAAI